MGETQIFAKDWTNRKQRGRLSKKEASMSNLSEEPSNWNGLASKIFAEMEEWRIQHPQATFDAIEEAVDQRLAQLRTQMIADSSQANSGDNELNLKIIK